MEDLSVTGGGTVCTTTLFPSLTTVLSVPGGRRNPNPPLDPIPVSRPFQILGMDVMELPRTQARNWYALVIQDYLTKWPFVFQILDQKSATLQSCL